MSETYTTAVAHARDCQGIAYYRVPQFGADSEFDAVHFVDDLGRVVAVVIEPESRSDRNGWKDADEDAFRAAVLAEAKEWDNDSWLWAQFDPGRDQCSEVRNDSHPSID